MGTVEDVENGSGNGGEEDEREEEDGEPDAAEAAAIASATSFLWGGPVDWWTVEIGFCSWEGGRIRRVGIKGGCGWFCSRVDTVCHFGRIGRVVWEFGRYILV